jgi:hypothetical protein
MAFLQSPARMSDLVVVTKGLDEIQNKSPRRPVSHIMQTSNGTDPSPGQSISSGGSSVEGDNTTSGMRSVTPDAGHPRADMHVRGEAALQLRSPENHRTSAEVESYIASPWSPATDLKNRCLEAFFHFFSLAHPFVLPKLYLAQMLRIKPLSHLEAAMRYVGGHYIKAAPTELFAQEAAQLLSRHDCVRDGFTVQAMLLLAIGLDGNTEFDRANEMLKQAQDLALEIGMNHRAFAVMHGEGLAVLEESWRRTWWELYVVDGMIAGVHDRSSFRLNDIPIEVLLPCEEQEYISGVSCLIPMLETKLMMQQIPMPHSFEEFEDQAFADDDLTFSSYVYRIAAIRNLGRVLQLKQVVFQDDPIVDQIDAYLVNWSLHLPDSKKLAINGDGHVDEMLFQGQMITNA